MVIKLLILTLFTIGCGREVKIPNKLETASQLNTNDLKKFQKSGKLIKGNPDQIQHNGINLKISQYSSHSSMEFIKAIPSGSQVQVIFTGGIRANEVVLETIVRE